MKMPTGDLLISDSFTHVLGLDVQQPGAANQSYECNVLQSNYTNFILAGTFRGIPTNLILNLCIWIILLIVFTFLRKRAWDYGRLALVQKSDQRWTQVFYGKNSADHMTGSEFQDSEDSALFHDKGACSWIKALFQIKDEQILRRNGHDAVQYLSFQRHIIIYLLIVCLICLLFILPVNCKGTLESHDSSFGHTTLSNLEPESDLIWIHIAFSFFFVPLGILLMRHFSTSLKLYDDENLVSRTLMISKIPKRYCDRSLLLQHFQEAYFRCVVQDIQLAYDVKKLSDLDRQKETATHARIYCENILKETGERLKMRPYRCGRICVCPQCPQVDALEYYSEMELALSAAVDREKSVALSKPVGIAFVTFQNEAMAEIVYKDHQKSCKCISNPHTSSLTRQLKPHQWVADFAPAPEDIYWENLSIETGFWYFKAVLINLALFLLFFFVTTPTVILNSLDSLYLIMVKELANWTPILSEFLPTFLLLVISVLLPVIVRYSDQFMSHWTRSTRNLSIMVKTFVFLLFMVVILPMLQLTSVEALVEWTLRKGETYRWKCVFLSGNGAFFVNYVITASFIGTALELIRFTELLMYLFYMCFSRSVAEQTGLRKAVIWEFEFGVQYAWFLLIFAVVIIYSLVVPLIAPFGLLCLSMKHLIDRYNIFFVYSPSKINQNIHAAAINFVVIALIVMQICLFFFLFLRDGWSQKSVVSLGICVCTIMVCVAQVSFHWFQVLSPIAYKKLSRRLSISQTDLSQEASAVEIKPFVPLVLKRSSSKNDVFLASIQDRSYGTNEDSVTATPEEEVIGIHTDLSNQKTYQRF